MSRYDYEQQVKDDLRDFIKEHIEYKRWTKEDCESTRCKQETYDEAFVSDSVTGNASGSYTCNGYEAEENICHNIDLLKEAIDDFGGDFERAMDSAESADVTIRCYILGRVFDEVWEEVVDEMPEEADDESEG